MVELSIVLWCLLWAMFGAVWCVRRFFAWVCTAKRPRRVQKPVPPPALPTADDNMNEVIRAYHANCARIVASPLDQTAKHALLQEEERQLAARIGRLLE